MQKKVLILSILFFAAAFAVADQTWVLENSTLTYHASHPLHTSEGVSHAAKGKGVCSGGDCQFLIAVPVKTFDSGDSNRDLHMIQATRGAEFPMVTVRTHFPESALSSPSLQLDLEIEFAGKTAQYKQVPFQVSTQGNEAKLTGTIPAHLSDFQIEAPSLLTVPIKNEIPIRVEMTWKRM